MMLCQQFFQFCVTVMMPVFFISQIMCMRMAVRDRVRMRGAIMRVGESVCM